MANCIYIGPAEEQPDVTELPAAVAITPGETLVENGSGEFAPAGADQGGKVYFALEDILGEITEDYAADTTVQGANLKSGQYYQLILAASQTIAKDDALTTNASGHMVALGAGSNTIAYAYEAVTTTGATGYVTVYVP